MKIDLIQFMEKAQETQKAWDAPAVVDPFAKVEGNQAATQQPESGASSLLARKLLEYGRDPVGEHWDHLVKLANCVLNSPTEIVAEPRSSEPRLSFGQWISPDDFLPGDERCVICWDNYAGFFIASYFFNQKAWMRPAGGRPITPIFWCAFPPPPKGGITIKI